MEQGEDDNNGFEEDVSERRRESLYIASESEQSKDSYQLIPYGFQSKAYYKPKSKSKEITGVTYNSRSRQFIILDAKGVTAWSYNNVVNSVSCLFKYPSYQFNLIRLLLHSKKYNVYFGLSKDYALKVFNLNFHEVFSVVSDMNSVLCMVFNSVTDELITGGTGGVKFWRFGEIKKSEQSLVKDSRPMANYGLILRFEHPGMSGSWVKDIILDESNQRLYCLSERNVVAYDLEGHFLFMLKSAHQGLVTACIYSKYSNFVVTAGTDCMVNVWSSNGGCIHSFKSHSKLITNMLIHPQAPSLVITASHDGSVKIFSLDIMEEIYSHVVFHEGVEFMSCISSDLLYCSNSKGLQVFSINHITDFWTTIRSPLKHLRLSITPHKTQKVVAIGDDNSTRLLSMNSDLLSTVLPPPAVTTCEQEPTVSAHAYCSLYGLMYLLVNQREVWVYYTKTNPANRVEVWQLADVRDIKEQDRSKGRTPPLSDFLRQEAKPERGTVSPRERGLARASSLKRSSSRRTLSPMLYSSSKIIDDVPCLALAFLDSSVILNSTDQYTDINLYLVAGLQDGRLLFLSPFAASVMYHQFHATKGAVVSIDHDTRHNTLVLQTATPDEYSIQIRDLPHLNLQYLINVGDDMTCFIRMDEKVMSGHKTGRLKLNHLVSDKSTLQPVPSSEKPRNTNEKKSKDHFDVVLSVDANEELKLFCSSSKDGCIKIWDNAKVLLREIIMDQTLTVICFLNSNGDLLAGFKNHLFFISHERVQLSFRKKDMQNGRESDTESDVYEDPRVRFEFKKYFPPDAVSMETYLVPFSNMSINLARYLSGNVSPSSSDDHLTSDEAESDSELSDMFSIAPTELYMSQGGTPLSRSRSSSLVSSWELPRLGCSPVSSPPRTPPPVMTPVAELESDEENHSADQPSEPHENFNYNIVSPVQINHAVKPSQVRPLAKPISSRRNRPGISQVKIDSHALRSKTKALKRSEGHAGHGNEAHLRGDHVTITKAGDVTGQPVQTSRVKRSIVKKRKQNVAKSPRRAENQPALDIEGIQNNNNKINEYNGTLTVANEERGSEIEPESKELDRGTRWAGTSRENTRVSRELSTSNAGVTMGEGLASEESGVKKLDESEKKSIVNSKVEDIENNSGENQREYSHSIDVDNDNERTESVVGDELQTLNDEKDDQPSLSQKPVKDKSLSIVNSRDNSANNTQEKSRQSSKNYQDMDNENIAMNDFDDSDETLSSSDENQERQEKQEKPVSKTVTFLDPETNQETIVRKSAKARPNSSQQNITKPILRSSSPVAPHSKVVPIVDSRFLGDGQGLVPSSALKIYTLAKTRRQSSSGQPVVSRTHVKKDSFKQHHVSQESLDSLRRVSDVELKGVTVDRRDIVGTRRVEETKERSKNGGRKDLVNWCLRALSDKAKYPVFSPKPRLRSRRSMNLEKKGGGEEAIQEAQPTESSYQKPERLEIRIPAPNERVTVERRINEDGVDKKSDHFRSCFMLERKSDNSGSNKEYLRELAVPSLYSEGWQDRHLERSRELKEKRLERERKVVGKQRHNLEILEEKRRMVFEDRVETGHEVMATDATEKVTQSQGSKSVQKKEMRYEDFKNNPALFHPYRLGKFEPCKDEGWIRAFRIDNDSLPDNILDFIPRPKSAPSIPSKCRKFMLVESSDDRRSSPEPTPLEETLLLKRFPKSKLKPRSRQSSALYRQASALYRPASVTKIRTVEMPCE